MPTNKPKPGSGFNEMDSNDGKKTDPTPKYIGVVWCKTFWTWILQTFNQRCPHSEGVDRLVQTFFCYCTVLPQNSKSYIPKVSYKKQVLGTGKQYSSKKETENQSTESL